MCCNQASKFVNKQGCEQLLIRAQHSVHMLPELSFTCFRWSNKGRCKGHQYAHIHTEQQVRAGTSSRKVKLLVALRAAEPCLSEPISNCVCHCLHHIVLPTLSCQVSLYCWLYCFPLCCCHILSQGRQQLACRRQRCCWWQQQRQVHSSQAHRLRLQQKCCWHGWDHRGSEGRQYAACTSCVAVAGRLRSCCDTSAGIAIATAFTVGSSHRLVADALPIIAAADCCCCCCCCHVLLQHSCSCTACRYFQHFDLHLYSSRDKIAGDMLSCQAAAQ